MQPEPQWKAYQKATLWELCGSWGWIDRQFLIRKVGGRALYEVCAVSSSGESVVVEGLSLRGGLHQIRRYLPPETIMELVPSESVRYPPR